MKRSMRSWRQQMTETEFKNRTAFTVDNSGSLEHTKEQIREEDA